MNVLMLTGIAIFLWLDSHMKKRDKIIFSLCIGMAIILNLDQFLDEFISRPENRHMLGVRRLSSFIGYTGRPLMLWGLWELLRGEKSQWIRRIYLVLNIVNVLVFSTCFFSGLTFGYDPVTYAWYRGPLCYTSHYVMGIMMILFVPTLFNMYLHNKKWDFGVCLISLVLVVGSVIYDTFFNHFTLTDVINAECVMYFMFLHNELEREYTKALIVSQKAEMMLMQIKPHFVNNTLGTIQALCEIDPKLAAHTTGNFARYLRMNLAAMDKPLPIPIEDEMAHTKTYLEIESLRFPWIEAEYDIQDTDFCVPALSIQPLVENAIQHGLRKQKHGKVLIRTANTEEGHMVQVIDNGSGFDEKNPVTKEGHGVGIRNVKYRIESVSNGRMLVQSNEGTGTTITIYIP